MVVETIVETTSDAVMTPPTDGSNIETSRPRARSVTGPKPGDGMRMAILLKIP
jgi:hypothetical protein